MEKIEKIAAILLIIVLTLFAFWRYFLNIFLWFLVPEKKVIMGKIIGFEEKPRIIYPLIQNQSDPDLGWNHFCYNETVPMKDHFVKVMNHGKKYTVKISDKLFEIINGRGINNVSLPCQKFSWEKTYDSIAE